MGTALPDGIRCIDLGGVNAYLVRDGDDLVLVDAGMPWHADAIAAAIREAGSEVPAVDRVLLTHFDLDHVGSLANLPLDAPAYAAEPDAGFLRGDRHPPLTNHKGALQRLMRLFVTSPTLPVRTVADGDTIGGFTAYHTPGHTPGHTVYVSDDLDVALLGDLVVADDGDLAPSSWVLSYDTDAVRASIRSLADRTPPFDVACPGHGRPLSSGGYDALVALVD